jgi:hypothetical protein
MSEAMRVKLKLEWRPKEVGDTRNVEWPSRKTVGKEWSQPRREAMWAAASKAIG